MKKRFLALFTVLLLAVLMTAAVAAAPVMEVVPATGVDTSALTEGQTFDVYIIVGPFEKIGSGNNVNVVYRVDEDTLKGQAKVPATATNTLKNMKYVLTWDNTSLEVSNVVKYDGNPSTTDQTAGNYKIAYLAKTAGTNAAGIQHPTITGVGSGSSNTGTLTIDYGSDLIGGYLIRGESAAPEKGVVAVVTFRVITGAEGGDDLPITMTNTYTIKDVNKTVNAANVTVSVEAGCAHATKTALTAQELTANNLENVTATCLVEGVTWYQCNDECGEIISVTTNKLDHSYTKEGFVKEPTCLSKGQKAMFCSADANCTAYDEATATDVDAYGHDFADANYAYLEPTCTEDGYELYWCTRCHYVSEDQTTAHAVVYKDNKFTTPAGAEAEIPDAVKLLAFEHDWVLDHTEDDIAYYECSRCDEAQEVAIADTIRYVSDAGTGDGSTPETPTTLDKAFDSFESLPAGVDCTIYLMGKVTLPLRPVSEENTAVKNFEETQHDATVTITTAPGEAKAELHFPFETVSMYYLYGPTVFDNIKISSSGKGSSAGTSASISIFARGFELTMTENFETVGINNGTITYAKTDGSYSKATSVTMKIPNCKLYLIGGIYPNGGYDGADNNSGLDINMNIYGGTYWVVSGVARNENLAINDAVVNINVGGKAKIGQLIPISTGANCNVDGTETNIHYYSGFTGTVVYRAQNTTTTGDYTVNHFFHRGSGDIKVGDFMMGVAAHAKTVNIYYQQYDALATQMAKSVNAKGVTYKQAYNETQEIMTFTEWCVTYGGGHSYVGGKCEFCELKACTTHLNTERVVVSTPTCSDTGLEYDRCKVCYEQVGDDIVTEADPSVHEYEWDITGDTLTSVCALCGKVRATYEGDISTIYVSDNGYGDGGFSADYPLNDYATAFKIAANADEDVTIYIVGTVTVAPNFTTSSHTVFAEPNHSNTITVCGYKNQGVFAFPGVTRTGKTIYGLNGNTTFENIEFSNVNNRAGSGYFYLAAQHNELVLGENITIDYQRNSSQTYNICSPVIVGGCYLSRYYANGTNVVAANCDGAENNITICSGTYYELIAGSVGGACGVADINVAILGDVSFRDYAALGGFEQESGDVTFTLDGTLSVGNYFSIVGVNKASDTSAGSVGNVVLKIYDGAIFVQNFETTNVAPTNRPLGGPCHKINGEYDITANLDTLTVCYDPAVSAAETTAMRFKTAPHNKSITYKILDSTFCEANANGEHTQDTVIEEVASTCAAQGYGIYTCSDCGEEYTVAFAIVPHTFGEAVKSADANCITPQIDKKTCECGFVEYVVNESVPATGVHTYGEDKVCVYCNLNYQDICEHVWGDATKVSSGCGNGTKTVCTLCDKVVVNITSADHKYTAYTVTVQPTATEPGIKTRSCKNCGKIETAVIYAGGGAANYAPIATDSTGNLANLIVDDNKLSKVEREALNALIQSTSYGSEIKVSYEVEGDVVTNITYSIPLPAEYANMENVKVIVKDDNGELHEVQFTVDKGYIVFTF